MVHILPGYPKPSPDDPEIALLAFYIQHPQGFSDAADNKDALKAIVESNEQSIGGSVDGTILSVQPLISTTEITEESDEESNPQNVIIIGVCVGGVILIVIIASLALLLKRTKR